MAVGGASAAAETRVMMTEGGVGMVAGAALVGAGAGAATTGRVLGAVAVAVSAYAAGAMRVAVQSMPVRSCVRRVV